MDARDAGLRRPGGLARRARRGAPTASLTLVQIVDRPGTDDDKAVYEIDSDGRVERLTLGRRGDEWVNEGIA